MESAFSHLAPTVAVVIMVGIVAIASYVFYDVSMHAEDKGAPIGPVTTALIQRGEYLTRAADCAACHTRRTASPSRAACRSSFPSGRSIRPTSRRIARPA